MKLSAVLFLVALAAAQTPAGWLKIQVIEGESAINNIQRRAASRPVVEVKDEQDRPAAGATVRFVFPAAGASGKFANGALQAEVTTDANGRAQAPEFTPNGVEGRLNIKVTAALGSREGSAVIAQTNTMAGGVGQNQHSKKALILVILAGAVGGGAAVALHGSGKSTPTAAPPAPVVLTVGLVAVGGPH